MAFIFPLFGLGALLSTVFCEGSLAADKAPASAQPPAASPTPAASQAPIAAQTPPEAAAAAGNAMMVTPLFDSPESLSSLRDPFRLPVLSVDAKPLTELETMPAEGFKLVAVTTGPKQVRAMIVGPNGKTYFVGEKTRIGVRSGEIVRISPRSIRIQEKIVNVLNQQEDVEVELKLQAAPGG